MSRRIGRISILTAMVAGALLVGRAHADESVIVDNISSPEGPVILDGQLYFVSAGSSQFDHWDGRKLVTLNAEPDCWHNGAAVTKEKTMLLACSNPAHGGIIEIDQNGKELHRCFGKEFEGGINDIVVAKNGGVYATVCGEFATPPKDVVGRVIYRAPSSDQWVAVAGDFNYANGVGLSPDQKTLYVSETMGTASRSSKSRPTAH